MGAEEELRDPRGYVTVPPSVVVKVTGTGRSDINGLLGLVTSYNIERERYLVHMTKSQSTMVLKPEHLTKASFIESYRAQVETFRNDPRVREKMSKYLNLCSRHVAPFKLSHVVFGVLSLIVYLVYSYGVLKALMITSLLTLIAIIAGPDALSGSIKPKEFADRSRTVMERQVPILRGRLSNRGALGVFLLLIALCVQSLLYTAEIKVDIPRPKRRKQKQKIVVKPVVDKAMLERFYNMGYEDAAKGREHGSSLTFDLSSLQLDHVEGLVVDELHQLQTEQEEEAPEEDEDEDGDSPDEVDHRRRRTLFAKLTSLSNIASMTYLYRSVHELGTVTVGEHGKILSVAQFFANLQHQTEWWRKALLAVCMFNILRIFL